MRKNGSITVYMSLVFSVILTLIAGSLQSVRMAYARVLTASAAEQGLYSIFSRFDRKLLEEYELFFWTADAERESGSRETCTRRQRIPLPGFWEKGIRYWMVFLPG